MICPACCKGNLGDCWGKHRGKTWCDNQHNPEKKLVIKSKSQLRRLELRGKDDEQSTGETPGSSSRNLAG